MTDLIKGTKAGTKNNWLRTHRDEVLVYYSEHGEKATREKYNIVKDLTWQHLLDGYSTPAAKLTKADRAIMKAEIAQEAANELKAEVKELKRQYGSFVSLLGEQLTQKFFIPLLRDKIEIPAELEYSPPDPLSLTNFNHELAKRGKL